MLSYDNNNTSQSSKPEYTEMFDAGMLLPPAQRVRLAQYYYQRVHLRDLGLRLAETCEYHILKQVFGEGAEVIFAQAAENSAGIKSSAKCRKISLA